MEETKYVPVENNNKYQELRPKDDEKKPDTLFLYFTIVTAIFGYSSAGTTTAWLSPVLLKLISNDTEVNPLGRPIQYYEISLMLGLPTLTSLLGFLVLPKLADLIGRKRILQILGFAIFLCFVGLAFSNQAPLFITFTGICNFLIPGIWGILPLYIVEICEDHNRAKFTCLLGVFVPIGQLYTYIVGSWFSFRNLMLLIATPLIPFVLVLLLLAESPIYLFANGRSEECMITLKRLRGNKTDSELETDFKAISDNVHAKRKVKDANKCGIFKTKEGRTSVILGTVTLCVQVLSGVSTVLTLMGYILQKLNNKVPGDTIAIIAGVEQVISFIFISIIIERTRRKPLLLLSCIGAGVPILILGIFSYLDHIHSPIVEYCQWVPGVTIVAYILFYSIGLGPVTLPVTTELFLPEMRVLVASFILPASYITTTMYVFLFPIVSEVLGIYWCFWIFSISCLGGAILIYILLPETKGKTILELQEILKNY